MIKRIIDVSNPSHLSLRREQLVIEQDRKEVGTIPLEDIAVLILDDPQITHTQGLLAACCKNNIVVLFSNEKHLPVSILLSLSGGSLHSKIIDQQAQVAEPVRKKLWQEIIRAKIQAQADVLIKLHGDDELLSALITKVKSGDPDNIEGRAAYAYWHKLFGREFRRDRDLPGINAALNYGYAVIRAAVARAVVGSGLHPALGLHHHNQYDSLCLADDLMEPLRPSVDKKVFAIKDKLKGNQELTREIKADLLSVLSESFLIRKQPLPMIPALHHYTASVCKVICKKGKKIEIPKMIL
jgi:CRISPR-associated protein Cas1